MSIKAPRTHLNQGSQATQRVVATPEAGSAKNTSSAGSGSDTVTLTNTVAEMMKLEENLAIIPEVDDSLVAAIKASITDGSYKIDSEKIVDNLLNIEKDLN